MRRTLITLAIGGVVAAPAIGVAAMQATQAAPVAKTSHVQPADDKGVDPTPEPGDDHHSGGGKRHDDAKKPAATVSPAARVSTSRVASSRVSANQTRHAEPGDDKGVDPTPEPSEDAGHGGHGGHGSDDR